MTAPAELAKELAEPSTILTDEQLMQTALDYKKAALNGPWPGVSSPHYALAGAFQMLGARIMTLHNRLDQLASTTPNRPEFPGSSSSTMSAEDVREKIQRELYECLCWWGTLPEPQGDVPERYHKWDDLGEIAERLIRAMPLTKNGGL